VKGHAGVADGRASRFVVAPGLRIQLAAKRWGHEALASPLRMKGSNGWWHSQGVSTNAGLRSLIVVMGVLQPRRDQATKRGSDRR